MNEPILKIFTSALLLFTGKKIFFQKYFFIEGFSYVGETTLRACMQIYIKFYDKLSEQLTTHKNLTVLVFRFDSICINGSFQN